MKRKNIKKTNIKTSYKLVGGFDRVVSALEMKGKVVEARGHHLPRCGGGLIIGSPLLLYFYP